MPFNIWIGNAKGTADVWTLTPASPEPGDTFVIEINNKQVSYTLLSTDTYNNTTGWVTAVISGLLVALAATDIPEFLEVTWDSVLDDNNNAIAILATGPADGKPVTISTSTIDSGNFNVTVTVISEGQAGVNEKQVVQLAGATSGTFTLTFEGQTTAGIAYNASAATVDAALEALSNIGAGDVTTTGDAGGPWTVEFTGALSGSNVALMTGNGSALDGGTSISVATVTGGTSSINEIQRLSFLNTPTDETFYLLLWFDNGVQQTYVAVSLYGDFTGDNIAAAIQTEIEGVVGETGYYTVVDYDTGMVDIEWVGPQGGRNQAGTYGYECGLRDSASPLGYLTYGGGSVIQHGSGSGGSSETQRVTVLGGPTGGTFTLTFQGQTTSNLTYDESATDIKTALEALSNITTVSVTGSAGGPWDVTFTDPAGDVGQMTGDATNLTGGSVTVYTSQNPTAGSNEVQRVSLTNSPSGGTFTLTFNSETTAAIDFDATAGEVQTALEGLATPVPGDFSVTGVVGGPWTVNFTGNYTATNVSTMTGDGTNLTGGGAQTFTTVHTTTGTGPNYFSDADNWSLGTVPVTNDTVVFENSSVSCLYGLAQSAVTPTKLVVTADFTGQIGLPKHTGEYYEYRATELAIGADGSGPTTMEVEIGAGEGSGSQILRLNTGTKRTRVQVWSTGTTAEGSSPTLNWRGTHVSNELYVYQGSVGIGYFSGQAATVSTLVQGYVDSIDSDSTVVVGSNVTLSTVIKTGGVLTTYCALSSLRNDAGEVNVKGSGAVGTITINGGTVYSETSGIVGKYGAITGITKANPAVVTSVAHGLSTGDTVRIGGCVGMTEVNQREFTVQWASVDTFNLVGENSSGYGVWSSGGYWGKRGSLSVSADGELDFDRSLIARSAAIEVFVYGDKARVVDTGKRLSTLTYLTGEFAVRWYGTSRNADMGSDYLEVRR